MIKLKKISHITITLLFLLQTMALSVSVPDLVLCVAEDHVQLELQNASGGGEQAQSALLGLQHFYHTDDCADVSLFLPARHVISKIQHLSTAPHFAVLFSLNIDQNRTVEPFTVRREIPAHILQRALRSVVLLI